MVNALVLPASESFRGGEEPRAMDDDDSRGLLHLP